MTEAVTVPRVTMMSSVVSDVSLPRDRYTQTD